jgi:hypothetical protein
VIEKVGLGLEVGEERTVGNASLFGDAHRRRIQYQSPGGKGQSASKPAHSNVVAAVSTSNVILLLSCS